MSHEQKPIDETLYYTAYTETGTVRHVGATQVGCMTVSGQPDFIEAESEQELLNACAPIDFTDWNELPPPPEGSEQGQWVEAGPYSYEGDLINCIQSHNRTIYPPQETPALFNWALDESNPEWQIGVPYEVDYECTYENIEYKCRQAHTSQAGWTPPVVPALWLEI